MMQRRHMEFVARILREAEEAQAINSTTREILAARFANEFAASNEQFKRSVFLDACEAGSTYRERSRS